MLQSIWRRGPFKSVHKQALLTVRGKKSKQKPCVCGLGTREEFAAHWQASRPWGSLAVDVQGRGRHTRAGQLRIAGKRGDKGNRERMCPGKTSGAPASLHTHSDGCHAVDSGFLFIQVDHSLPAAAPQHTQQGGTSCQRARQGACQRAGVMCVATAQALHLRQNGAAGQGPDGTAVRAGR